MQSRDCATSRRMHSQQQQSSVTYAKVDWMTSSASILSNSQSCFRQVGHQPVEDNNNLVFIPRIYNGWHHTDFAEICRDVVFKQIYEFQNLSAFDLQTSIHINNNKVFSWNKIHHLFKYNLFNKNSSWLRIWYYLCNTT